MTHPRSIDTVKDKAKLSDAQRQEVDILLWFAEHPECVTDEDVKKFLDYSSKGIGKEDARRALHQPKGLSEGFVSLMVAKRNRDLQIADYMRDWGDIVNAWSFIDEPQYVAEWIAKKLDREAIIMAWHEDKIKWYRPFSGRKHKLAVKHYQYIIDNKQFNKCLDVRRSL